ncbi:MAG: hypothetical protein ACRYF4_02420 [Janthinobacterium lividum]
MFRFATSARHALFSLAALSLLSTTAFAQTTPADAPTPPAASAQAPAPSTALGGVSRRIRANRQARVQRNILDTYSHRYEIAGGGGFLRFRTGQYLQRISQVNFFMTGGYALNPKLSIVGDVRGMYGKANIPNLFVKNNVFSPNISEYTFMAGPQYRFYAREKYSISASATGGVALSKFGGDAKGLRSEDLGMWPDSNYKPVFAVNLIGDYNIYNNLAIRVQPTYLGSTFGGTLQNNLGVQVGVVYRLGRQK